MDGRDCLGNATTVDVVPGPNPGDCEPPVCMVQPLAEGGHSVFIATMCAPYPQPDFDFSGKDPDCPLALAALARGDFCLDDGGSQNPAPDAAADADADSD